MAHEHRYERRVQFADTDMAGIAHFSVFFKYAEEAEHAFYRSLGLSVHALEGDEPLGLPRAGARCEFLKPARCEDVLDVHLWVRRKSARSIVFQYRISKGQELLARGETAVICCRTLPGGRLEAAPLPPALEKGVEEAPYPPLEFRS